MIEQVTLSKQEYDKLKSIEFEFNILKETPEKYIKMQIPNRYNDGVDEIRIISGNDAIQQIKKIYDVSLQTLKEDYDERIKKADAITEKYKPLIDFVYKEIYY